MKVKTLKPHGNQFGKKYLKKKGDVYSHPTPEADIEFKYVEEVKEDEKPSSPSKSASNQPG